MATYKPLRIGDATRDETSPIRTFAADDTIETPLQVSQGGVVLGRITGAGAHQEILFADLPGGGAASIVEITYADMATALAGATLTPGQYYNITDAAGTDLGFVCMAVQADEITVSGTGGYLNADFQAVGDYSGVEGITGQAAGTQQGIWQAANEGGYTQGDIVIWNLLHWQLTDSGAIDGTDPATNTAAYTQLLKTNTNQGYITAWDGSEFDFPNAWLQYREDVLGNKIRYTKNEDDANKGLGYSAILDFQFGRTGVYANISDDGYMGIKNIIGFFYRNSFTKSSEFSNCTIGDQASVYGNTLALAAGILSCTFENESGFNTNTFYSSASIENVTFQLGAAAQGNIFGVSSYFSDCNIGQYSGVYNNILENGAQLTGITAGANCSISRNKVGQGATLGGSTTMGDGAFIEDNILESGASITDMQIDANVECSGNRLSAQSAITGINAFGSIYGNILGRGCAIGKTFWTDRSIIGISSSVSSNVFVSDGGLYDFILGENSAFFGNTVGASSAFINLSGYSLNLPDNSPFSNSEISLPGIFISNIDAGHTFKKAQIGASSFERSINITGLTTLDCLAENNYVGIFNAASSNATETINQIDNAPTAFPIQIRPAAGLVLTVTGTAYAGIAAGQIALTTADVTLDGDKGEYLELEIDPLGTGALIERRRVAGIL